MKKFSKILSVALVVVMLFSTFAFSSSAIADGKDIGFVLKADKKVSEIVPGAAVTVTLYFDMADWDQLMSDMKLALLYDSTVYTPDTTTRTFLGDWANYANDATTAKINANFGTTVMNASSMSTEEKATYNSAVMLTAAASATKGCTSTAGFTVTKDDATGLSVAQCSMVFNVTGDAAAVAAGNINIKICDTVNKSTQAIKETDGSSTPAVVANGIDVTYGNILANMPAFVGPTVAHHKDQIRFDTVSKNDLTTYAGTFDYRVLAEITLNDATIADNLKMVGFVFNKGAGATIDLATAKADVQAKYADANATTTYSMTTKAYVSTDFETGKYIMACVVNNIPDAEKTNSIASLGYVVYEVDGVTNYAFFETAATAQFSGLYNTYYSQQFGA